jgi:hypothetical protein
MNSENFEKYEIFYPLSNTLNISIKQKIVEIHREINTRKTIKGKNTGISHAIDDCAKNSE